MSLRFSYALFAVCVGALVAACAPGQRSARSSSADTGLDSVRWPSGRIVASRVNEFMTPYVAMRDFSGRILIARAGHVLVSRGYGFADFERRVPADDRTAYGIGSITKTMTAAAIQLLAEQGRLSLTDPITQYLLGLSTVIASRSHTSSIIRRD